MSGAFAFIVTKKFSSSNKLPPVLSIDFDNHAKPKTITIKPQPSQKELSDSVNICGMTEVEYVISYFC